MLLLGDGDGNSERDVPISLKFTVIEIVFGEYSSKFLLLSPKDTFIKSRREPFNYREMSPLLG